MMTIDFPILCKTDKLTFVFGFKLRQATLVFSPKKKKKNYETDNRKKKIYIYISYYIISYHIIYNKSWA